MKASLSSERWEQVHHLFNEVVDLDPDACAARLDQACHDDPALRQEVESLLTAYLQADDLLEVLDRIAGSSSESSAARPSFTGTRVAHYEVLEKLGGGGMGVVYKALDTRLKRIVALKFLPPQWSQDARAKQRFEHEAQAASALDHPNICTIFEIGETQPTAGAPGDGQLFIAMAYCDGETLKKKIKQGPLPLDEALDIAAQIARGLAKAHTRDIVHRDIKPANVMITDEGVVKIVDFGLAKMADVQMTKTGTTMGTVAYMSPEQTKGEGVDHRADVWSLGVVLFEMLTGERPFKGDYDQAIIYSLLNEDPASITEINPELPEEVEHVVTMCLEKEKDLRYPSVADLLADLEVLTQSPGSALLSSTGSSTSLYAMQRRKPRIPRKAIVAGVLVVLLMGLAMWWGGKAALPTQRYLAVLPFTFAETDLEDDQAFADGLEETFRNKLAQLEQFQDSLWVVPTEDMASEDLASNPVASPGEARQLFGVNLVVEGQVERINEVIRLTLTLVDTKTLKTLRSKKVEGQGVEDPVFQAGLLTTMTDLLDLDLTPQVRRSLSVGETTESAAHVYYLQGRGYLQRYEQSDQVEIAIALFDRARQEDPGYALAYAGLGEAYWRKFNDTMDRRWIEEAETYCERALELNRNLAPVYVTRGLIDTARGQFGSARLMFDLALERDPANAAAYRGLANVYEELGEPDQAEATYQKAIALKPDYWGGYNNLGIFYHYQGRHKEAAEQFQHVIDLTPDNHLGYNNAGAQHQRLGRPTDAFPLYLKSVEVHPNALAYRNMGMIYFRESNYVEAAQMLEKALELQDMDFKIWNPLANAYHWSGQRAKAQAAWQRTIELAEARLAVNPRAADALSYLADAYTKIGGYEQEAYTMIARLLALKQIDQDALGLIASAYEQLGERDLALQYLQLALENGHPRIPIEQSPWYEDLRADLRYQQVIQPYLKKENASRRAPSTES